MDSLVDGRFSLTTELGVLGGSGLHINGVYGAVIWHRGLFEAFTGPFSIYFWSVAGAWAEGEEGDTGASLFFSGILLPVPHGKLVELQGSLTAKVTEKERNGDILVRGPAGQTNEGLWASGWLAIGTWSGTGGLGKGGLGGLGEGPGGLTW